jgi:putative colanic acid biosynthesis UDP-glucose lipid carrier transferase
MKPERTQFSAARNSAGRLFRTGAVMNSARPAAYAPISPVSVSLRTDAADEARAPTGGRVKRAFDVVVSLVLLVVLLPLLALIALLVCLDSPGPAFFRQDRIGFAGRSFRIWKFRTMRCAEDGEEVVQARRADGRITRLGAFLRRASLDEIPQLINVLMGDMSLIGPRPHAVLHDNEFTAIAAHYPERRRARPGITGLAQVRGFRGPTETVESVVLRTDMDVQYVRTWSFLGDLRIMLMTAWVVLANRNVF